jgi:hypothetical protein
VPICASGAYPSPGAAHHDDRSSHASPTPPALTRLPLRVRRARGQREEESASGSAERRRRADAERRKQRDVGADVPEREWNASDECGPDLTEQDPGREVRDEVVEHRERAAGETEQDGPPGNRRRRESGRRERGARESRQHFARDLRRGDERMHRAIGVEQGVHQHRHETHERAVAGAQQDARAEHHQREHFEVRDRLGVDTGQSGRDHQCGIRQSAGLKRGRDGEPPTGSAEGAGATGTAKTSGPLAPASIAGPRGATRRGRPRA